jgi:mRNA-degrading endonuclease HigB of HigAB toxin-antitoxin module
MTKGRLNKGHWLTIHVRLEALKPFCEGNPDAEFQFDRVLRAVERAEFATPDIVTDDWSSERRKMLNQFTSDE